MINASPRLVAQVLLAEESTTIELGGWMLNYLVTSGIPELRAFELVDDLQPAVVERVDAAIAKAQERGVLPDFVWVDGSKTFLARPAMLAEAEGRQKEELAQRLRGPIWSAIATLTGTEFERVCDHLLDIYGIIPTSRGSVGGAGDGGVDFYGILRPYPRPGSDRLLTFGRRFLGQAKIHHGHTIGPDELEAFASRIANVRLGVIGPMSLPDWFVKHPEPLWGLFVTAGRLGPAAAKVAIRGGIYAIEGDQVGEDLARSPLAPSWLESDEFTADLFRSTWSTR